MTLSALLLFAGALFLAAGSPGPSVAALVARVLSRGYRDVLPFLAAMWIGEVIWLSLALSGLSVIATSYATLFAAVKWAGVGYLLYIAWKMWFSKTDTGEIATDMELPTTKSQVTMFLTGLAMTMGNPKIMFFYVALLPTLIDLGAVTMLGWFELMVATILVLAIVDIAWVLFASKARLLIKSPRAVKLVNRFSAAAMAGAAAAIISRS